jgi:hypothetical protein
MKHTRMSYKIIVALLRTLYGERDATQFKELWVPLIYQITQTRIIFNWDFILSTSKKQFVSRAKHTTTKIPLAFYMSLYLLDVACVVNILPGLGGEMIA